MKRIVINGSEIRNSRRGFLLRFSTFITGISLFPSLKSESSDNSISASVFEDSSSRLPLKNPESLIRDNAMEDFCKTYKSCKKWNFSRLGDLQDWEIAKGVDAEACGGALRIKISNLPWVDDGEGYQSIAWFAPVITSPSNLELTGDQATQVQIRLLNRSPDTDAIISWRTKKSPDQDAGATRFTMKAFQKDWQDISCNFNNCHEIIDQIQLRLTHPSSHGDIFIASLAITDGHKQITSTEIDITSDSVVPRITMPGIDQREFNDAFIVLHEALITNVPVHGFTKPVIAPGGGYGENWWQLDSSLAVAGAKWASQVFAEGVMIGFSDVQDRNPDGRIDLWGASPVRGMPSASSSLPRIFESGYDTARRSSNKEIQKLIFDFLRKYLDWWLSPVKCDNKTGLIMSIGEETFSNDISGTTAAVDTNMAVAVGLHNVSQLARRLGMANVAEYYESRMEDLKVSINTYLWIEEHGAFFNLNLDTFQHSKVLSCTTFDTLRLRISDDKKVSVLLDKLLNPALFNWGVRPLTSISKTDARFVEATGIYDGRAWFGDIWTMRNVPVIAGLRDIGRHDLSSELSWATIKTFNGRYAEYITPTANTPEGQLRYAWSASQYIELIIEYLFGIDYDVIENRVRIMPAIPTELYGKTLELKSLLLPTPEGTRISVKINQKNKEKGNIELKIDGNLQSDVQILIPVKPGRYIIFRNEEEKELEVSQVTEIKNMVGIFFSGQNINFRRIKWVEKNL